MNLEMALLKNGKVYVLLEHAEGNKDCRVHGIYAGQIAAEKAKARLQKRTTAYVSVLAKKIKATVPLCSFDLPELP